MVVIFKFIRIDGAGLVGIDGGFAEVIGVNYISGGAGSIWRSGRMTIMTGESLVRLADEVLAAIVIAGGYGLIGITEYNTFTVESFESDFVRFVI